LLEKESDMPFIEFRRKRLLKRSMFPDCVYASKSALRFSVEFWKTELGSAPNLRLFYNEETGQVGMLPSFSGEGYRVSIRKDHLIPSVNWKGFLAEAKLNFMSAASFRVEAGGSKEMRTFTIFNGGKA
jgi:hypothetical protein